MPTQHKPIVRIQCPFCPKTFGQEVAFARHTESFHDTVADEALYVRIRLNGVHPTCQCAPDCAEPILFKGWKLGFPSSYVRGHNARVYTAFSDPAIAKANAEKRRQGYADGRYSTWNKGRRKETDERIAEMASKTSDTLTARYESGDLIDWRIDDPEKAAQQAAKMAETKRQKFASGELKSWNEGLTKETNESLARAAVKISARYDEPDAGRRVKVEALLERVAVYGDKFELVTPPGQYTTRRVARLDFRCVTCRTIQRKSLAMLEESPICFHCHPKSSVGEQEVYEFVKSLAPDAVSGDRTVIGPRELDVWVPSRKLGIEYDGLYWHSAPVVKGRGGDPVHEAKFKLAACNSAGISLFSVFEDEWRDKRPIVEGMLRSRLGLVTDTLDARKLDVRLLDRETARAFFEANHLEGHAQSSRYIGLVEDDGTVAAAVTLRRPFHRQYADAYELGRSCCRQGVNVRGWLGRLSAAARKQAAADGKARIISYVDSRVGMGSSYEKAGWTMVRADTGPRFWWTDGLTRMNRFGCKADKSRGMSQAQVAVEMGVEPIHGCPNSLWSVVV